jgi:N-carbamoyl-L-amino-acid hydrolase
VTPLPDLGLAEQLFETLAAQTRRGRGIERDSYGPGEQAGHDIARAAARAMGLDIVVDAIGNLTMVLPGRDRAAPMVLMGSHLDSVPQGGNFDGAAGVVAGLTILSAWRKAGRTPARDLAVMAIRAEESAWFDVPYVGSAGAFGLLDPACLSVRRADSGQTLKDALTAGGFDPGAIRGRRRLLDPARIAAYLELHIEQAPVLVHLDRPVAVVTGIRGCRRLRNVRCLGATGHSGALPRAYRQDAVAASVALLGYIDRSWQAHEAAGADLVVTTGEFTTDPAQHGPSKVAGETRFVIDIRSVSDATMEEMEVEVRAHAAAVEAEYRVEFDLGEASYSPPAVMDDGLQRALATGMATLGLPLQVMASGAGHDAAIFAAVGVPAGMIFIRNQNGSHNPDEAMDMSDFALGTRALAEAVTALAG